MQTVSDHWKPHISTIERMTITMPADMASVVKAAVDSGDYARPAKSFVMRYENGR